MPILPLIRDNIGIKSHMPQHIGALALLVDDYDAAIDFYTRKLGFALVEDTDLGDGKRWVVVSPPGSAETRLLLAKAANAEQRARVKILRDVGQ